MVICDMDHPDVEEFIRWKVKEEQKVASLVAGSKLHELKLNEIFSAIRSWDGAEEDAFDPKVRRKSQSCCKICQKSYDPRDLCK